MATKQYNLPPDERPREKLIRDPSGKTLSDSLPELGNERKSVLFRENFLFIGKNGVYLGKVRGILHPKTILAPLKLL